MLTATEVRQAMGRRRTALLTLGILTGLALAAAGYYCYPRYDPVRLAAWEKVTPRLAEVEEASKADVDESVAQIRAFFAERHPGARDFASDVLSLGGKWAYVKDYYEPGSHNRFLEESFVRHIFSPEELRTIVDSAVSGCVSKLQGRENQLLVDIRADLADGEMAAADRLPALHDEAAFRQQYEAMLEQVMPIVSREVGFSVTREVVSFVGSEIAAQVVAQIAQALAVRLGISGGILGTGAYSGTVTFGIGLVVGILVDMALDWAIREAGYDPEGEIAAKVDETLDRLESTILDGPSAADFPDYPSPHPLTPEIARILIPPRGSPPPSAEEEQRRHAVAEEYFAAKDRWFMAKAAHEDPGSLGMRNQLSRLHEARARLRQAALRRLILEGGTP
ncbi:hypothetical protein [Tautonia sociabilis]|uniref:Uncharacterized protein n=1 Tax=Tautonia sociabilis TaxID=2080755 RepID=A0A432MPP5_9BACT|nr:hypothetical protein [Tautonia sociabilis]RUL89424.1 hypothetical protein TsocGM_01240 [Tautonia sociabilis]